MEVRALLAAPAPIARAADPDAELVAAARAEPRAFLGLYDRYFERVLGYARLRIRAAAVCEDVTSQVFTNALAQIGRFRGDGTFAAWLFGITRNAVRDVQRQPASEPLADQVAITPAPESGPAERFLECERSERLHAVIKLLQPEQQHLLALRYGAELGFDEIGAMVGAAPGTVRVRMHRILEELRRRYPHEDA
jgi:RNA polymerase sigma-70 factor, ECF subfamily